MSPQSRTVIETKTGKIEGIQEKQLFVFRGVPYAAPPVGELRWLPPQPHQPWAGVRPARSFGPSAIQLPGKPLPGVKVPGFGEVEPQNEDCLFLNIWTPGLDNGRRPVMVWIHGGGFMVGSGSLAVHSGEVLASRGNAVIVTINYRLGMLGFLNLNEVTQGKIPATGNEGLLDQIAALEWVKENIAAFGGDPANITIFGESAGAMSIGLLLAMPRAQGSFHKAILQSGVGSSACSLAASVKVAHGVLDLLGLRPGDTDKLRAVPVEKLLAVQKTLSIRSSGGLMLMSPVIDGKVLPPPLEAIRAGAAAGVPVIIGTNLDELKLFEMMESDHGKLDEEGLVKKLEHLVPAKSVADLIDVYRDARARRGEPTTPAEIASAVSNDFKFRIPAARVLEARVKNRQTAYAYLLTWRSPALGGVLGACHILELGFVFGHVEPGFCGSGPLVDQLAVQFQDAWLSFARTGNPSCESLGEWPQYGLKRRTMVFSKESHMEDDPYDEERQVWDNIG